MKRLSKKEWIGVGIGLVVIIVFFNKPFFSFLTSQMGSSKNMNNQENNQELEQNMSGEVTTSNPATAPVTPASVAPEGDVSLKDVVIGTGKEVKMGSQVTVNYIGTLDSGIKFDSSYDSGRPLQFQVGARQLIPGFEAGVIGMKVGGKREVTIPPEFGYGAAGSPPVIPPNSTLIFTIEVVDVK